MAHALELELHAVYARKASRWTAHVQDDGASHATVKALELVEGHARRVLGIKANPPAYRGIVDDLAGALVTSWGVSEALVLEAADDIAATVDRHGRGKVGMTRAARRIDQLQRALEAAGQDVTTGPMAETYTRYLSAAFLLGQAETTRPLGWEASFSLVDQDAVAGLSRSGLYWIGKHYGEALDTPRLLAEVEGMIRDGMGRVDGGARLRAAFGAEFHRSDAYWRGLAATVATRSRSFGALSGMEATGATVYEYTNPLDERTSDVCEALDGTRFTVKGAVELRERLIGADPASSPEDWKAISPWPKIRDVLGPNDLPLPAAELQAKGIAWPPLHFHCRSSIDVVAWSEISPADLGDPAELRVERAGPKPRKPKAKPAPPLEPEAPPPPPPRHAVILGERIGPQRGSNPGGMFRGTDGVARYVKHYTDPAQAAGEHLANRIYRDLGLAAPRSELFRTADGRLAYASEIMDVVGTLEEMAASNPTVAALRAADALDGFACDFLTVNWDAAGLNLDNLVILNDATVARIDNGGAFLARAMAGRKDQAALIADNPDDWWRLFERNAGYSRLAKLADTERAMDLDNLADQVDRVLAVRANAGGSWRAYIGQVEGLEGFTPAELDQVAEVLEIRTTFLARKAEDWRVLRRLDELEAARPYMIQPSYTAKDKARAWGNDNLRPRRVAPGRSPTDASGGLFSNEYRSMRDYTGSGYDARNGALRAGSAPTPEDQLLIRAINRSELPEDVVLYRGARSRSLTPTFNKGTQSEWAEDTDAAFGSTSLFRQVAVDWKGTTPDPASHPVKLVFRVLARKGQKAMWVDDVSTCSGEIEAKLPPGSTLRAIRCRWNPGGWYDIDAVLEQ